MHVTELSPSLGIFWSSLGLFSQVGSSRYLLCVIGRMPSESQAQRYSGERNREARSKVEAMSSNSKSFFFFFKGNEGLPQKLNGKESTCQCKGHGFNP